MTAPNKLVVRLVLCAAAMSTNLTGQTPDTIEAVEYFIRLDQPQTQRLEIGVTFPAVERNHLDVSLPTWRPGRYVILNPASGIRAMRAHSSSGATLELEKIDKSSWRITTRGAETVRVDYQVYANSAGDRTRHVDDSHAFLSGSSVFLYAPTHRQRPVVLHIDAPEDWRVATGLEPLDSDSSDPSDPSSPSDPRVLFAQNYDVLVDSPLEIGLHEVLEFDVAGKQHQIVLWPTGTRYDPDRLQQDTARIVEQQLEVFGRLPYQRYVFLIHVGAGTRGGTEHLNSTIMQTSLEAIEGSVRGTKAYKRFLGLVSHEFFHTWNVKQLRPAGIHPYDYQTENYSEAFWVAEGTTSYFAGLTLTRAGLQKTKRYLEKLGEQIDEHRNRPGSGVQSLAESSFDAWIEFARRNPDGVNSSVSFYDKGELVSLLLDLEIRRRTSNRATLDDVLRTMFELFPLSAGGYDNDDLRLVIEELTGASFSEFFSDFVYGTRDLPFEEALAVVGLEVFLKAKKDPDTEPETDEEEQQAEGDDADEQVTERAFLGATLREQGGRFLVSQVLTTGPAYTAGLLVGDEVVTIDRRRLSSTDLEQRLIEQSPGDRIELHVLRYDHLRSIPVVLDARPNAKWAVRPLREASDRQKAVFESWLQRDWPKEKKKQQ